MKNVMKAVLVMVLVALVSTSNAALVHEWSFDGDLLDTSGNGNDGVFTGGRADNGVSSVRANINYYSGFAFWGNASDADALVPYIVDGAMQYSYIGRVDLWRDGVATHPKQLTGKTLSAQKVLMADACFKFGGTGGWLYNHGLQRSSVHRDDVDLGGVVDLGPPQLSGLNRCYGDGSVEWRPAGKGKYYDPELMQDHSDRTQPRVITSSTIFY